MTNHTFPTVRELCLDYPLYKKVVLDFDKNEQDIFNIQNSFLPLDTFCVDCKMDTTFISLVSKQDYHNRLKKYKAVFVRPYEKLKTEFDLHFMCPRNNQHLLRFYFVIDIDQSVLLKIGQYPSLFDISSAYINKYDKILDAVYIKELKSALITSSHGYAVASYAYFRRIYEYIINEIYNKKLEEFNSDQEKDDFRTAYETSRWDEKIELLKNELPDLLVQNKSYYAILSKGIHMLSEEECNDYLPIIKNGLFLILDNKIENEAREKQKKDFSNNLSDLVKKIQFDD